MRSITALVSMSAINWKRSPQQGSGMRVAAGRQGHLGPLDPRRVLGEAQYPSRTIDLVDQDGTPLYLAY